MAAPAKPKWWSPACWYKDRLTRPGPSDSSLNCDVGLETYRVAPARPCRQRFCRVPGPARGCCSLALC
ncbi:hypothetical protein D9623_33255 (plasmid) [Azospirillum brasilense]|uniref:Uncharacterized protein n=1 Tax=Azospirillum brasilense TaxID=192 RepID=A0A4D8QPG7_AZOBR|nr:hypothetical protein D3868_27585 [Azospirillum brasilense]QEL93734.1 hypothetical protein D9621_26585 [Azospirillum brasilense]QEM00110.1 hypothetical protein D9623_27175 [Azospirillum brasilense]QEM01288.1 hypothetical protein D9623_33255 [Azospirillum brasilense]